MIERFIDKRFSASSLAIIEQANAILREYDQRGLVLTLRQLYYQFVSRGLMPNKQTEYKRLGTMIISGARLAGMVDWDMVATPLCRHTPRASTRAKARNTQRW
jgi:hypothetical protein